MKLKKILKNVGVKRLSGPKNIEIAGITDDSRKVKRGYLFVAIKGLTVDARKFIPEAVKKGASAVVYQGRISQPVGFNKSSTPLERIVFIQVKNDRRALSIIAGNWYDNPSEKLKMIGVTGTDGKTTTCNFIYSILKSAGKKAGLITSISARIGNKESPTGFHVTNPEPIPLQRFLNEMVEGGMKYCVLEVTSHGLHQHRVAGIEFEISVITNVTKEHLDYHKNLNDLVITKSKIGRMSKRVFVNRETPSYQKLKEYIDPGKLAPYSLSDIRKPFELSKSFPGEYNQLNAAAAFVVCRYLGIDEETIRQSLKNIDKLEGRFEYIDEGQDFDVVVDFAHTPAALESVLKAARKKTKGKLILVFGCAGLRDRGKRPVMGRISQKYADIVVLTAEDPRTEDVKKIVDEIAKGNTKAGGRERITFFKVLDRREAINFALQKLAKEGDLVLITGKGHEESMCYGITEHPWSDRDEVIKALKKIYVGKE